MDAKTYESTDTPIEFLECHTDPWPEIVTNWTKASHDRDDIIKETTLNEYFQRFPCLGLANGFEFVSKFLFTCLHLQLDLDFLRTFPVTQQSTEWHNFASRTLKNAEKSKDVVVKSIRSENPRCCCLKLFFVFDLKYPDKTAMHIWEFINIAFFTKNVSPCCYVLLGNLNAIP